MGSLKSKILTSNTTATTTTNTTNISDDNKNNDNNNSNKDDALKQNDNKDCVTSPSTPLNNKVSKHKSFLANSQQKYQYFRSFRFSKRQRLNSNKENMYNTVGKDANISISEPKYQFDLLQNLKNKSGNQPTLSKSFSRLSTKFDESNKVNTNESPKSKRNSFNSFGSIRKRYSNNSAATNTTGSNSNILTEDDLEWEDTYKQNDTMIADLKQQIDILSKQLESLGREDTKIINDLSEKIEKLAKMNHTIIESIESQTKQRNEQQEKQKEYQQTQLLEEYYRRINQQNEILMNQQRQIEQLRNHLYTPTNPAQFNLYSPRTSYAEPYYDPASNFMHQPAPPPNVYGYFNAPSDNYFRASHSSIPPTMHYYSTPSYTPTYEGTNPHYNGYYNNSYSRYRRSNSNAKLYYDPATGCYYYQRIVPTTSPMPPPQPQMSNPGYYYRTLETPIRTNVYVYSEYTYDDEDDNNNKDDEHRSGVIITEITDEEEAKMKEEGK